MDSLYVNGWLNCIREIKKYIDTKIIIDIDSLCTILNSLESKINDDYVTNIVAYKELVDKNVIGLNDYISKMQNQYSNKFIVDFRPQLIPIDTINYVSNKNHWIFTDMNGNDILEIMYDINDTRKTPFLTIYRSNHSVKPDVHFKNYKNTVISVQKIYDE